MMRMALITKLEVVSMIRFSRESDRELIYKFMEGCFNADFSDLRLRDLDKRFYLNIEDDSIVAMSGLLDGKYMDFTCWLSKKALLELLSVMLDVGVVEVHCFCWSIPDFDRSEWAGIMEQFGYSHSETRDSAWICSKRNLNCKYRSKGSLICGNTEEVFVRHAETA